MPVVTLLAAGADRPLVLEESPQGTVGYWLLRLSDDLAVQREVVKVYENYFAGLHPMQFATSKFREAFGSLFSEFADNWCPVVVDSSLERLTVQGFRFGARETYEGDAEAWDIWQRNGLDADADQ